MKAYSYIRFSTPEQFKGDSLRRQTEFSEKYATSHGLVLDDTLNLKDLGISAYSGKHRTEGALGQFLALIEEGKIKKGSVLLVESLDRLSREQVTKAFQQFIAIINKGIKIVTLIDNREYSEETINNNLSELIISLTIMSRAHEESATKAMRLGKAWEGKRQRANIQKLTARCPAWLQLNNDKIEFTIIPDAKEAIYRIFDMKLSGKGTTAIIHELNAKQEIWKPKSNNKRKTAEGWRESYVKKILQNRAVIGEYQPHRLLRGKRRPIGEPIPDYYPAIVDKDVFYRVQEQLRQNIHRGGRTGTVSNLFSHILKCGYCGGSLAYVDKGPLPKGGKYLVCDKARRGLGCCKTSFKYNEIERLVLSFCRGLNPQDILDKNDKTVINLLKNQYDGIMGKLNAINNEIENVADSITTTADKRVREILDKRMIERLNERESLNQTKAYLEQQIEAESKSFENVQLSLDSQRELLNFLESEKADKKVIDIRLKLRNEMKKLIERIVVYPAGTVHITPEYANKALKDLSEFYPEGTVEYEYLKNNYQYRLEHPKEFRSFKILFKSGSIRSICPTQEQFGAALHLDFDMENRVICNRNLGQDKRLIFQLQDDKGQITKHYRRSIGRDGEEVLREIIDMESDRDQVLAEEAYRRFSQCDVK